MDLLDTKTISTQNTDALWLISLARTVFVLRFLAKSNNLYSYMYTSVVTQNNTTQKNVTGLATYKKHHQMSASYLLKNENRE